MGRPPPRRGATRAHPDRGRWARAARDRPACPASLARRAWERRRRPGDRRGPCPAFPPREVETRRKRCPAPPEWTPSLAASDVMRPAHRLPAHEERKVPGHFARDVRCGADGAHEGRPRARCAATLLHVGKLVAERGDPAGGELAGRVLHERVPHAGAGAVCECQEDVRIGGAFEQGADFARLLVDREAELARHYARRLASRSRCASSSGSWTPTSMRSRSSP